MGVLESMRSGSDSTFMQVVLALVVVSFVFWYAKPQGDTSRQVAMVNGQKIMDTDYGRAYRNDLRSVEARTGRTLSDPEQKQLGEQVKQTLIQNEVLLQEAHRLGLEVSDSEIARSLLGISFLLDESGQFDMEQYQRWLKRNQFTRADFEERMRDDLLRGKLQQLVSMGASLSEPALREAYTEAETRIDLKTVRIRPSVFSDDVDITDDDLSTWVADNEEALKEAYDSDFDRLYNHPETVRLRLIRLGVTGEGPTLADLVAKVNTIRKELDEGADFGELAKRWSEDPSAVSGGDMGLRPVPQLSLETSEAIIELEVGQVTRAVTTDTDVRLYKLEERVEPIVDTFDSVRHDIADRLIRDERMPVLAAQFAEETLLPAWREADELPEDALSGKGLVARDTGPIPAVNRGNPFAPPQALLDAARTAELGTVLDVFEDGGTLWVAQVTDRTDPDMEAFDEQRDVIRESVLMQRRQAFYEAWVADLKSRANIQ